jgi:hypothetical protein
MCTRTCGDNQSALDIGVAFFTRLSACTVVQRHSIFRRAIITSCRRAELQAALSMAMPLAAWAAAIVHAA